MKPDSIEFINDSWDHYTASLIQAGHAIAVSQPHNDMRLVNKSEASKGYSRGIRIYFAKNQGKDWYEVRKNTMIADAPEHFCFAVTTKEFKDIFVDP